MRPIDGTCLTEQAPWLSGERIHCAQLSAYKRQRSAIYWSLFASIVGCFVSVSPMIAAPLDVPSLIRNRTSGLEVLSALYDERTVSAFVLPPSVMDAGGDPVVLITAMIEVELLIPGRDDLVTMPISSLMMLTEKDLEEFPTALTVLTSDQDILPFRIDSVNQGRGLEQLRRALDQALERQDAYAKGTYDPDTDAEPESQPNIQSTTYDPETVSAFVIPRNPKSTMIMSAMIKVELRSPGAVFPEVRNISSLMLFGEDDLDEYPGPLHMLNTDQDILPFRIDSADRETGLEQLRKVFAMSREQLPGE